MSHVSKDSACRLAQYPPVDSIFAPCALVVSLRTVPKPVLSPIPALLQSCPVREYTCFGQFLHCILTITAIYTLPNESRELA